MGLLTSPQKTAIGDAPVYRQRFHVHVPRSSGSSTTDDFEIHDDDGGPFLVLNAGKYDVEGYNQSLAHAGNLTSGLFRIEVSNKDGIFNASVGGVGQVFYNTTGSYAAMPSECSLSHETYVRISGSWVELTMVVFEGPIMTVEYDDNNGTAVIEAAAQVVVKLQRQWNTDDGAEYASGLDLGGLEV